MKSTMYALFAGAASLLAIPAAAQDADPSENFNGIYVGASGGYDVQPNDRGSTLTFDRNLDGQFGDPVTTAAGTDAFSPGFCSGRATGTANQDCTKDEDGWSYNGRIGADTRFGSLVVGAVGEFGKSEVRDSVSGFSTTPASYTLTRSIEWEAAARGRAGYVAGDSTLFYGTFGVGYARINRDFITNNTANTFTGSGRRNQWGYQAGGGVEQMIGKSFSIGLEYMYHDYNDDDYRVSVGQGTAPATNPFVLAPNTTGTDIRRSDTQFRWHSIRATVGFHF